MKLLTRTQFRETVLSRNSGNCCVPYCSEKAVDAHHILNRNLFSNPEEEGGYYEENGAQLCEGHHLEAELTLISPEELREYCNITKPAIPESLDAGTNYDCWGNIIVNEWEILPGIMFKDEGCQKALKRSNKLWRVQTENYNG